MCRVNIASDSVRGGVACGIIQERKEEEDLRGIDQRVIERDG